MKINFIIEPSDYFDHPHNSTLTNERCIEVPIGLRFLDAFQQDNFIEVGAVLPYYIKASHKCIDPTDKLSSIKEYAENINYKGMSVLSISTIEHIGHGDYGLHKKEDHAAEVLLKIHNESHRYLISWPIGYNKKLDSYTKESNMFEYIFHKRIDHNNWILSKDESVFNTEYGAPFKCGNAVIWVYKNL